MTNTGTLLASVLRKAHYWNWLSTKTINNRQWLLLNRLLDGFDGKLSSSKWAKIANCSTDTALRDSQQLMAQGVLAKEPGGSRSTSYILGDVNPIQP